MKRFWSRRYSVFQSTFSRLSILAERNAIAEVSFCY